MNNLQNNQLNQLYTIEAKLRYGELPISFKEGFWGYGWQDLQGNPYGISDDEKIKVLMDK